jgi:ketosteroid isomerase-like protein
VPVDVVSGEGHHMTRNKAIVERYMDAFERGDDDGVLACLTEVVEWDIPGAAKVSGKAAFRDEIHNPAFSGRPEITTTRLVEEGDVVVAEGRVRAHTAAGLAVNLVFCDVFELRDGLIRRLTSYLVVLK